MATKTKPQYVIVPAIAFLAIVVVALAVRFWPRTVPFDQCSDLYKQYANVEGIDATFIKDYKVNDTVFVDVTLIDTKDSVLWDSICTEFGIAFFSQYPIEYKKLMTPEHSFDQRVVTDTLVAQSDTVIEKSLVVFSHLNRSMCIFHHIDDSEYEAIINNKYKEITF